MATYSNNRPSTRELSRILVLMIRVLVFLDAKEMESIASVLVSTQKTRLA